MSATWDSKALKATPLAADEILLIDTADSRNQKRATITSLPFSDNPWTVNHDGGTFTLTNISALGLSDTSLNIISTNFTTTGSEDVDVAKLQFFALNDVDTELEFANITINTQVIDEDEEDAKMTFNLMQEGSILPFMTLSADDEEIILGSSIGINMTGNSITDALEVEFRNGGGGNQHIISDSDTTFDLTCSTLTDSIRFRWSASELYIFDRLSADMQGDLQLKTDNTTSILRMEANHTTPANGQIIGDIQFFDDDNLGASIQYAGIQVLNSDPSAGSADGELKLQVRQAGTLTDFIIIDGGTSVPIQLFDDVDISNSTIPLLSTHFTPQGQDDIDIAKIEFFAQDSESSSSTVNFGNIVINSIIADVDDEYGKLTFELMSAGSLANAVVIDMNDGEMLLTDLTLNMGSGGISNCNEIVFVGTNTHIIADTNTTLQLVCNEVTDDIVMRYSATDRHIFSELSADMQGDLQLKTDNTTSLLRMEANHTTPAADQIIGDIQFFDDDDLGASRQYASISAIILDPTNTTIDGQISLKAVSNNVLTEFITAGGSSTGIDEIKLDGEITVHGTITETHRDPRIKSSILDSTNLNAAEFICSSGNYSYVLGFGDFSIIDKTDSGNPKIISTILDGVFDSGSGLCISGNYVYTTNRDDDFTVIDVSNVFAPIIVTTINESTFLNSARAIYVRDNYVYVSASDFQGLTIVDVSDKTNPTVVGSVSNANMAGAKNVYVFGKYAYVVATNGTTVNSLSVIDVSDVTAPLQVGIINDDINLANVNSIFVTGRYAFVASVDGIFSVIDVSNPTDPTFVDTITDSNMNGSVDLDVVGDYAYVTGVDNDAVVIINISDPENVIIVASITATSPELSAVAGISVEGKYAYVVTLDDSFTVLDISGILAPTASIGSVEAGSLSVLNNAVIANDLYAGTLNARSGAIHGNAISGVGHNVFQIFSKDDLPTEGAGAITSFRNLAGTLSGYTDAENITLSGGSGTGAAATAVITGSTIQSITLTDGGSDYEVGDILTITGDTSTTNTATIDVDSTDGAITLISGTYDFRQNMTLDNRFVITSNATVTFTSINSATINVNFSGSGEIGTPISFITISSIFARLSLNQIQFTMTGTDVQIFDTGGVLLFVNESQIFMNSGAGVGVQKIGIFDNASGFSTLNLSNSIFQHFNEGFTITNINNTVVDGFFTFSNTTTTGSDIVFDYSSGTTGNITFRSSTSQLNGSETYFNFDNSITGLINIQGTRAVGGTFYDAGGLDQTSVNVIATGNNSPNSAVTGETSFIDIASPQTVTITTQDTPVPINGGTWTSTSLERFTIDGGGNGILTYIGLETQSIKLTYYTLLEKAGGGSTDIEITLLVNGSQASANAPRSVNAGIIQISGTDILTLSTNDTLQLAVTNRSGTANIEVSQANMVASGT